MGSDLSSRRLIKRPVVRADCRNFTISALQASRRGTVSRIAAWSNMQTTTFETTDPKVARRCRYDQHRGQKTTLTVGGSLVTGLVRSVMEVKSPSNPTRWIVTVLAKQSTRPDQLARLTLGTP